MSVEIYRNLHKNMWSVREDGRVTGHPHNLMVQGPKFVVQPAGNRKVRETGRKNVHAFVRAVSSEWVSYHNPLDFTGRVKVTYNPYANDSFVTADGIPVVSADNVVMTPEFALWAHNPVFG